MATAWYLFSFVLTCACALGCSEDGCVAQGMEEEGTALSLLQTSARVVIGAGLTANNAVNSTSMENPTTSTSGSGETGYINIMRHAEICLHGFGNITPVGFERAAYLGRCMSNDTPSIGMPFGKATAVVVGSGLYITTPNPMQTAEPLIEKLHLQVSTPCDRYRNNSLTDPGLIDTPFAWPRCLAEHALKQLTDKGTVVVFWIHTHMAELVEALAVPNAPREWPSSCPSYFTEDKCVIEDLSVTGSTCYDAFYQVKFTRSSAERSWEAQSIRTLFEGFAGTASCPCAADVAPISH